MSATPAILSFDGDLDIVRIGEVRRALQSVSDAECAIVDIARVRYLEACVLGSFARLAAERKAARLRAPIIVVADGRLRRLFEITGLDAILVLCETIERGRALCSPARRIA